jgi:hypothetical protein
VINPNLYNPSLVDPKVKVVSAMDRQNFRVTWPPTTGVDGYRVYAGFDPFHIRSLVSGPDLLPNTQTEFLMQLPAVPPKQVVYFWVASKTGANYTFIEDMGSYALTSVEWDVFNDPDRFSETTNDLMCGADQLYFIEEMRRRSKAILEDTGEEVDLFIKQWVGLPDPTTQNELGLDPSYQGMTRDIRGDGTVRSYGVGFFPGYFPAIRIRVRMGGLPVSQLDFQESGLRPLEPNEAWSLWDPMLHEGDIIVRANTGVRYVVKTSAFSNYRGVPMTQRFSMDIINPTSPLYTITDMDVWEKWNNIDSTEYSRIGFNQMPAADANERDYVLFR